MLSLIWAEGPNKEMGLNGKLPWRVAEDIQFFKMRTANKLLIMGRNTFDTIPPSVLNNAQRTIVLTSKVAPDNYPRADVAFVANIQEVLACAKNRDAQVVGGAQIYEAFMPYADFLYVTRILIPDLSADTYAPSVPEGFTKKYIYRLSERAEVNVYVRNG